MIIAKMEEIVKIAMVSEKVNVKENDLAQLAEKKRRTVDHLLLGEEADLLRNIAVDPLQTREIENEVVIENENEGMIENEIGIENEEKEIENEEEEEEENVHLADLQMPIQTTEVLLLHLLLPLIHQIVEAGADLLLLDTEISLHVVNETGEIEAEAEIEIEIDEMDHLENLVTETFERVEILVKETMREIL